MQRRVFLQASGSAAVAATVSATVGLTLAGTVVADHDDAQPEEVTIYYDREYLETYRPLLQLSYEASDLLNDLYGWVATHEQYDTNVCVYWAEYVKQNASRAGEWLFGGIDGHVGDHEPVQVEVNASTGEVERVRASIYHWLIGRNTTPGPLLEDTNPRLKVIDPWHQFSAAEPDAAVQELPVENLGDVWDAWLANGMESAVVPGASRNPWRMRQEPDFWRQGNYGLPVEGKRAAEFGRFLDYGTVGSLEVN